MSTNTSQNRSAFWAAESNFFSYCIGNSLLFSLMVLCKLTDCMVFISLISLSKSLSVLELHSVSRTSFGFLPWISDYCPTQNSLTTSFFASYMFFKTIYATTALIVCDACKSLTTLIISVHQHNCLLRSSIPSYFPFCLHLLVLFCIVLHLKSDILLPDIYFNPWFGLLNYIVV